MSKASQNAFLPEDDELEAAEEVNESSSKEELDDRFASFETWKEAVKKEWKENTATAKRLIKHDTLKNPLIAKYTNIYYYSICIIDALQKGDKETIEKFKNKEEIHPDLMHKRFTPLFKRIDPDVLSILDKKEQNKEEKHKEKRPRETHKEFHAKRRKLNDSHTQREQIRRENSQNGNIPPIG